MNTIKLSPFTRNHSLHNALFYMIALGLILVFLTLQPTLISIEQVKNVTMQYDSRIIAYIISFFIMLVCALTPLPAEIIALGNTFFYTPTEAFLVTWVSAMLSAQAGYEFGRLNGYDPCKFKQSNRICHWLNSYGYKALAITRLIPVVPFFALNIGAGILKINRCKYAVITSVTIIPAIALLTLFPQLFL
ncbi:TVP38/TMEM64 family protein [Kaarinaea lacus]